ncbi:hypothetical protein AC578_2837 [Pseudocercospora eumusae]|uniref:Restriction endonuclease domain-containing protein n=1 Tax=Pseudocercospora eumusae TaxID=321146 RepID=A0A139H462_9PEZI|nr:hypothetical protein AC578_2837 [Pseudocercospora eumusae]
MSSPPELPSVTAKSRHYSALPLQKPLPPSPPLSSHSSRSSSPLSAYQTVLSHLHLHYAGLSSKEGANRAWQEFRLSRLEFQRLYQQHLHPDLSKAGSGFAHWCSHKLRWDYDSDREIFVVRMPDAIHEVLIERIARAILEGKEELQRTWAQEEADGSEGGSDMRSRRMKTRAAAELQKVDSTRNTAFTLPGESDEDRDQKRSPDASFAHQDAKYPSLILEVAYSQSDKSLKRLARDYIHLSGCHIACVVGVHLAYNEPGKGSTLDPERDQTAKFSIWQAALDEEQYGYCKPVLEEVCFRNADGSIVSNAPPLELTISDILPNSVLETSDCLDGEASVAIMTSAQLTEFLEVAERHHQSRKQTSRRAALPGQKGTRKRVRTPEEEELSDSREAKYQRQEDADAASSRQQDRSYSGRVGQRRDASSMASPISRRRSSRTVQDRESSR